jgi:zinc resistance-associated protein
LQKEILIRNYQRRQKMKFSKTAKVMMVLVIAAVLGIGVTSFAGWGRGPWGGGYHMGPYRMGPGYGMMQPDERYGGPGYQGDLSDEEIAKLEKERLDFYKATEDLRETLYQKELELRSELAKPEPDAQKAAALQKEISSLESQLDQKRLEQSIKMRKDFPRFGSRGYGYGPRGKGRGMYGSGGYGPGFCWN